jgi:streptomycin 6-kinase
MHVPPDFIRTIVATFGDTGVDWLARLPALLEACVARWELTLGSPFALSYHYVVPATRANGSAVVLKLGCSRSSTELAALRLYNGRGCAQLLDSDATLGALLLECMRPGTTLATMADDARATTTAAAVMRQLWRPVPDAHPFRSLAVYTRALTDVLRHFGGSTGPFPAALVERAERLRAALLSSMGEQVVLHGDLHHFNILAAERQPWLAIDPKGIIGEPAFEAAPLLRNPYPHLYAVRDLEAVLHRRVVLLSEQLGLARERICGWGIAYAVLSAWWSFDIVTDTLGDFSARCLQCAQALCIVMDALQ